MRHLFIILLSVICTVISFAQEVKPAITADSVTRKLIDAAAATASGGKIDSVLAIVNGDPITEFDVIMRTEADEKKLKDIFSGSVLLKKIAELRKEALEEIITRKLVYAKYKSEAIFDVNHQDIESLLDDYRKAYGETSRATFEKRMEQQFGYTPDRLQAYAREIIAVERMLYYYCERNVYVSPKEVYEEFDKNREKWTQPEQISIQLLQCSLKTPEQIKNAEEFRKALPQLPKAEEFAAAVAKYYPFSADVTLSEVTGTDRSKLRSEFKDALKDAAVNYVAGPINISGTGFFLRVTAIEPEKLIPFSKINKDITASLKKQKVAEARKIYAETLRNNAYIQYFIE